MEEQTPEMLRCSISKLVLMAKELNCAEPKELLGLALDPPKLYNIESTILNLKEVYVAKKISECLKCEINNIFLAWWSSHYKLWQS
jgi:HrpA-like RNA helicase